MEPTLVSRRHNTECSAVQRTAKPRAVLEALWLPILGLPMDALLISLAFYGAYWIRFEYLVPLLPIPGGFFMPWSHYASVLPAVITIWMFVFLYASRLYEHPFMPVEDKLARILSGAFRATVATLAATFLYKRFSDSRLVLLLMFPLGAAFVFTGHVLLQWVHSRILGLIGNQPGLLLVGEGPLLRVLTKRLRKANHRTIYLLPPSAREEIAGFVRAHEVQEVILTHAPMPRSSLVGLAETLESDNIRVRIVPSLLELRLGELQVEQFLGLPMLRFHHLSLSGTNFMIKRVFDLAFCLTLLIVGFIPLLALCLLIKWDSPGPILFKQKRVGCRGRKFEMYKFRTMVADAERRREEHAYLNQRSGPVFKIKNDPRVTRVGRWLRRFSLDELPQCLNVLKGDMSVVGPRPPLPSEVGEYDMTAMRRLNVLPGITGLWQVSGRADLSFDQMVALDLYYIEHWSPGLDFKIVLKTLPAALSANGAY